MEELNRRTADKTKTLPLKILQFGGGNFLRAFVDWMVQTLNEETGFNAGVVIIKPTEGGDYQILKSQDGKFTVVLDGIKKGNLIAERKLITCVQDVVNPYSDWDAYLKLAENDDLRFIVSNTTEAGITFNAGDTFDADPPKEFPAKLTVWLYYRFQYFKGDGSKGCILLPCELIENNGEVLKQTIVRYIDHWQLGDEFKHWVTTSNHFCSTLVDRIVSGFPTGSAEEIQKELGYKDRLLVAGEYYHSWVIQGPESIKKELPFAATDLNVEFVEDLAPYREMKVRILNGAHTAMVPIGYLAGLRSVKEVMDDEIISEFVESLLLEEACLTLDFPERIKQQFVRDVLDRFRNPTLEHKLISISLNSTSKFVARLLPTLKEYYQSRNELPERIVLALAALILFYRGKFEGQSIDLKDNAETRDIFTDVWARFDAQEINASELVQLVLSQSRIWGEDLTRITGLSQKVAKYREEILGKGVYAAVASIK